MLATVAATAWQATVADTRPVTAWCATIVETRPAGPPKIRRFHQCYQHRCLLSSEEMVLHLVMLHGASRLEALALLGEGEGGQGDG